MLDTRTMRELFKQQPFPGLLNAAALSRLRTDLAAIPLDQKQPVTLVSPAPVVGIEAMESLQRELVETLQIQSTTVDAEAWSLNRAAFVDFFDTLLASGHRRILFLSGDVHYGFVAAGVYERDGHRLQFVQLTSSATKNRVGAAGQQALAFLSSDRVHHVPGTGLSWRCFPPTVLNNVGLVTVTDDYVEQSLLSPHVQSPDTRRIEWARFPVP